MSSQPASAGPLRVTLDATALLGPRTGIGKFVEHLTAGLAARPDVDLGATAFTTRGWRQLADQLPLDVRHRGVPAPARLLRQAWLRTNYPPVEWISGRAQVFHGTNFVLPPTRSAAGVLTVHDLAYLRFPDTVNAASAAYVDLVPAGLRRAAVATAMTQVGADELADAYGFPLDRIVVTPNGVDPSWFDVAAAGPELRTRLGLPEQYLLFVGTREPRKGLPTLLAAHAPLASEVPLVLVGGAGWGDQLSPGPGVLTLGYLDQADLRSVVAGAAGVILPSLYEGFGLPVLEAFAAGAPVVISNDPAMLEVAGGLAANFPVGDAEALTDQLRRVVDGRHASAAAARRHAALYTWDRTADAAMRAYRLAVG